MKVRSQSRGRAAILDANSRNDKIDFEKYELHLTPFCSLFNLLRENLFGFEESNTGRIQCVQCERNVSDIDVLHWFPCSIHSLGSFSVHSFVICSAIDIRLHFNKTKNKEIIRSEMSSGFVTESEVNEAREKRQAEWEKVRQPDQPMGKLFGTDEHYCSTSDLHFL